MYAEDHSILAGYVGRIVLQWYCEIAIIGITLDINF